MKLAIILAATFAVAFGKFIPGPLGTPWVPEPRGDQWWVDRHNGFVQNSVNNPGGINVLFYGDSITEGWGGEGKPTFDQYYAPLGTANYGIGGDRTEHVWWRVQNGEVTENLNPKVCVLKIGTNNLGDNDDTSIATGVLFIVQDLRERLPNMKILLLGVLPRNNEELTRRTSNINDIIKNLDNGRTIRYLDMKNHFYRGGNDFVTELYTSDLLHLSAAGYRKWAEVMDPLFREMLG
ncbi:Platelet-activating factor acetylhydrolase IB subunit beta [Orchesella cincta]|uniref:Platelet-activating factor acetylhydrolase IB subunit beta n=1 Tax=Orchesella cincta TaxID=48709 RepID=A0A1D2NIF3_ORCCI|nr:Platelet-activating factor acetylhydrolase IB subunit beta [Orchesella cincta]